MILEDLIKFYTKTCGKITLHDLFSILLYFVNNSDEEKSKIFFLIHSKKLINDTKNFRVVLLNYIKDVLFLLSNFIIDYNNLYETPESLVFHLSCFSEEKVECFFKNNLHKDISSLNLEGELKIDRINQILKNISYVFNFHKIR